MAEAGEVADDIERDEAIMEANIMKVTCLMKRESEGVEDAERAMKVTIITEDVVVVEDVDIVMKKEKVMERGEAEVVESQGSRSRLQILILILILMLL